MIRFRQKCKNIGKIIRRKLVEFVSKTLSRKLINDVIIRLKNIISFIIIIIWSDFYCVAGHLVSSLRQPQLSSNK